MFQVAIKESHVVTFPKDEFSVAVRFLIKLSMVSWTSLTTTGKGIGASMYPTNPISLKRITSRRWRISMSSWTCRPAIRRSYSRQQSPCGRSIAIARVGSGSNAARYPSTLRGHDACSFAAGYLWHPWWLSGMPIDHRQAYHVHPPSKHVARSYRG